MAALTLLQRFNQQLGIVDPANSQYAAGANTTDPVALVFDVIPTEENEMENIGTTNPIETGAFVSDHIRTMPEKANFTAVISQAWPGGLLSSPRGPILSNSNDVVTDAYNYIHDKIFKAKAVFDFVSGLKVYQTYFMSQFKVNRDVNTSMALSCSFTIQELVIVQTQVINAPKIPPSPNITNNPSTSAPSSTVPAENLGPQSPVPTSPAQQAENTTFLNLTQSLNSSLFGSGPLVAQ